MKIITETLRMTTGGICDMKDITAEVSQFITDNEMTSGTATVFVPGATGGLTTIEYEGGLVEDFSELMERLAPCGVPYHHDRRWGDGNGFSHIRASLLGPSLTIPFVQGKLTLGTWQQIVFVDFDNRSRNRQLVVQLMGE